MNISPVSFRSTTSAFQQMVSQPQAYAKSDAPAAASGLKDGQTKKSSLVKKLILPAAAVVAAVAGLAIGAKNGKFTVGETTNKTLAKVLPYLEKAGNAILNAGTTIKTKFTEIFSKNK